MARFSGILLALAAFIAAVDAFSGSFAPTLASTKCLGRISQMPSSRGGLSSLEMAHHPNPKGAKKSAKDRPKKHSLADINRKAPAYAVDTLAQARQKIPEYSTIGKADMGKFFKIEKSDGTLFYHVKEPHA